MFLRALDKAAEECRTELTSYKEKWEEKNQSNFWVSRTSEGTKTSSPVPGVSLIHSESQSKMLQPWTDFSLPSKMLPSPPIISLLALQELRKWQRAGKFGIGSALLLAPLPLPPACFLTAHPKCMMCVSGFVPPHRHIQTRLGNWLVKEQLLRFKPK